MIRNYKRTVLYFLATLAVASNCYSVENIKQTEEPDYSETQWRTFYGEKPVDYRPEYWVTYYGSGDNEDCYKPNVVSVVDGKSRIRKEIYKEFIAEEKDDGKRYIIRYPNRFKVGNCMYSNSGGQLYIEEKSNDIRLNQEPYLSKKKVYRRTIIRGAEAVNISLVNKGELGRLYIGEVYLNKIKFNLFCHKIDKESFAKINSRSLLLKSVSCFSSSYENKIRKVIKYNSYIAYGIEFWKKNIDIEMNFKVGNKIYRNKDSYCQKTKLPKISEELYTPETFNKLYLKRDK
ncbi:hypothetical protein HYE54_12075 [Aggregatibacter actinomycetemcomitans]|uniref:hypothetical protein n=1 Tax=Aggregatibacter actinomycetemcomitans TaxID=714 RepID=UPI00197B0903|nr:hypothetical protein [Aggregatibacter actinomycetemcomitans]MBN6069437.1 hypothetical protein [Aggregatibacter actinomycetemcomitans]MBN6085362.1 hypothetical protein [Aggregatibacter actinomycetemcomitans]